MYFNLFSNVSDHEDVNLEPFLHPTEMRRNPYYSIYYINPATLLVTGVIPLALLAYWNYVIYTKIKSSSKRFEQTSTRSIRLRNGQRQENEFAKVFIGIVVAFVFSHSLRIVLNFQEAISTKSALLCIESGKEGVPFWILITNELNKLLLVINSSANIIIYCCMNSKFRQRLLRKRRRHLRSENMEMYASSVRRSQNQSFHYDLSSSRNRTVHYETENDGV